MATEAKTETAERAEGLSDLSLYLRLVNKVFPVGFPADVPDSQLISGVISGLRQIGVLTDTSTDREMLQFIDAMKCAFVYLRTQPQEDSFRAPQRQQLFPAYAAKRKLVN